MTTTSERPIFFACKRETLLGILHSPQDLRAEVGMLLVVGGPQYRVGSHRQFVLLARHLADQGIPVFRFDCRGMGDSSGEMRDFERIGNDICAAADTFCTAQPEIRGVVLWGLCDAATANAFYASSDSRVRGQVSLNPWLRTGETQAQTLLKHYYPGRAFSSTFWRDVLTRRYPFRTSMREFARNLRQGLASRFAATGDRSGSLPQRLARAQISFDGPSLIIVSGQDLTAKEYLLSMRDNSDWQTWISGDSVNFHELPDADHTFSRATWRNQVSQWSADWILDRFPRSD